MNWRGKVHTLPSSHGSFLLEKGSRGTGEKKKIVPWEIGWESSACGEDTWGLWAMGWLCCVMCLQVWRERALDDRNSIFSGSRPFGGCLRALALVIHRRWYLPWSVPTTTGHLHFIKLTKYFRHNIYGIERVLVLRTIPSSNGSHISFNFGTNLPCPYISLFIVEYRYTQLRLDQGDLQDRVGRVRGARWDQIFK